VRSDNARRIAANIAAAQDERYRLAQAAKVIRQLEQVAISGKTKNRRPRQ